MRVLVTGADGFVGSHLVDHLQASGDDVVQSSTEILDAGALIEEFRRCRPIAVYHLAAQADVAASWADPARTLRINVEGTFNVLDAARRSGAERVLTVTSADVYGRVSVDDLPVSETAALRPVTPYGASKAAAEMVCLQAGADGDLGIIRARAFNHLGPGQSHRFVASALASRIVANERSGASKVKVGNLETRRDFTDVRDVVRAYRLLVMKGQPAEAYNVCSGTARSVQEIAEQLLAQARMEMKLEVDETLLRPVDVPEVRGDYSKLHSATAWKPNIPLADTLKDLLVHWRRQTASTNSTNSAALS